MATKNLHIKEFGMDKFQNALFGDFLTGYSALIVKATPEKLGVADLYSRFSKNLASYADLVQEARAAEESASLELLDKKRDNQLRFIFGIVDAYFYDDDAAKQNASVQLIRILKPYRGSQDQPVNMESQNIVGMVMDLRKTENVGFATALALTEKVTKLEETNNAYKDLRLHRTSSASVALQNKTKEARTVLGIDYSNMNDIVMAKSVLEPSDDITTFIVALNRLIDETQTNYRQLTAKRKNDTTGGKTDDKTDSSGTPTDTKPVETPEQPATPVEPEKPAETETK